MTPSNPNAIKNLDGSVDLSASVLKFSPNGKLYISSVLSDNSILEYNPINNEVKEFVSQFDGAQPIPSGITFDENGNLYNGTFSTVGFPFPGFPPSTVASYDPEGNIVGNPYIDNANGELGVSSRVNFFDIDGDGIKNFFITDFLFGTVLEYQGPNADNPSDFVRTFISENVSGGPQLVNPAELLFISESEILIPLDIDAPESFTQNSLFDVAIEFGEDVTGFQLEDIIVKNGSASDLTEIDGNSYVVNVTPNGNGDITLDIQGGAVIGQNNNTNFPAPSITVSVTDEILSSPMYRFRNTTYETGVYLYVNEGEKEAILANPNYNKTFVLEGEGSSAFEVSFEPADDLLPFYRLQNKEKQGTYLFVGQEEYDSIFSENSPYRDQWVKEGSDSNGNDQPDFYTYGAGSNQGESFVRFRNQVDGGYLFAGAEESDSILNNSSFSNIFVREGVAFEALA